MRSVALTSNSLKYEFLIKAINDNFNLVGVVTENKGINFLDYKKNYVLVGKFKSREYCL